MVLLIIPKSLAFCIAFVRDYTLIVPLRFVNILTEMPKISDTSNVVDMSRVLEGLAWAGWEFSVEDVITLSLYLTRHSKKLGDCVLDLSKSLTPLLVIYVRDS